MYQLTPEEILNLIETQVQQITIVPLTEEEERKFCLSVEKFLRRYTQMEKTASEPGKLAGGF